MNRLNTFLHSNREWAPLPLRLIAGWMLLAGAGSIALFITPITGVVEFFEQLGIPIPSVRREQAGNWFLKTRQYWIYLF